MKKTIKQLLGISVHLYRGSPYSFFTPFNSTSEGLYTTVAIVSAPLIFTVGTAFFALKALANVYEAIINLVTLNFSQSKQDSIAAGTDFFLAAKSFVFILLSPFINTVNCIGSAVNSLQEHTEEPENDSLAHS